jgi:hypothetical protein
MAQQLHSTGCAGLNAYIPLIVPPVNSDGPLTSVANLIAEKTIYLTGTFNGEYIVLGSHDNVDFVPIAKFNGNGNPQSAKLQVDAALNTVRVRRNADAGAVITVASRLTCACVAPQEGGPFFGAAAPSGEAPTPMAKAPAAHAATPKVPTMSVTPPAPVTSQAIPKPGTKGSAYAAAKPGAKRADPPAAPTAAPAAPKASVKAPKRK